MRLQRAKRKLPFCFNSLIFALNLFKEATQATLTKYVLFHSFAFNQKNMDHFDSMIRFESGWIIN